jgi:hypothetical protein
MSRSITDDERRLVLKLTGDGFADLDVLRSQLETCRIINLIEDGIIEFEVVSPQRFKVPGETLGEGSFRDVDEVPIILTLLQRAGRLWQLDIYRADGQPMKTRIDPEKVMSLGYGQGLTLEY